MESHASDDESLMDENLMSELAVALRPGAAPLATRVAAGGRAAFTFRTMDEELQLVSLVFDSLLDDTLFDGTRLDSTRLDSTRLDSTRLDSTRLAGQRAPGSARTVVFESSQFSVEIEVADGRLVGQLAPPMPGSVSVEYEAGARDPERLDDLGCFAMRLSAPGPVRLHFATELGEIITEWTLLHPAP